MRLSLLLGLKRHHLPICLVLVAGSTLSLLAFQLKREVVAAGQRAAFAEFAHGFARGFQWELDTHIGATESLRDFLQSSPTLEQAAFDSFARATLERAPAIHSLQWMPVVSRDKTAGQGKTTIEVASSFQPDREGPAEIQLQVPFIYAATRTESRKMPGFDSAAQPFLVQAMPGENISGRLVASEPIPLQADDAESSGTLLLLPVLAPEGEIQKLRGFVAARLDVAQLGQTVLSNSGARLRVRLQDRVDGRPVSLFASAPLSAGDPDWQHTIAVGGREWDLLLHADTKRAAGESVESFGLLGSGLLFTLLTALWVRQRQDYLHSIEEKVDERTAAISKINTDLEAEIMQRRRAETELVQSEHRFRAAFLHAPVGIGLLSPEGRWLQVNQALTRMTGFSEADFYAGTLADLLHPDERQQQLAQMGQMLAGEIRTFSLEQRFRHHDGHFLSILMSVSQVRDAKDQLLYFVCQILDITERNRALAETRRAKEFSENIIKSSHDGIFAFDLDGLITVWNAGMEEITGIPSVDAVGRPSEEVLPFLAENENDPAFQRVLAGGNVRAAERTFSIPSSGRRGYLAGHYAPLHDDRNNIIGGVAVVRDVTEQRQARERLQAFAELLKQRNRELQDFAYVASHDLQEPLRKIRAFGDRLFAKSQDALDEQSKDYLKRMQDAAGRMQTLINDLLSFSRVSTEAHPFAEVNLASVVQEVLVDLESRIEETDARIEVAELPVIEADSIQMRQLLQNLIGNALKYHRPGIPPHIQIYATTHAAEEDLPPLEGGGCLLHVEDNGIGFDEKYLARIFTVFQRLHGRNLYPGTGIGLAICRKIAERHNGWITARSAQGEGSTFITGLPYKQNKP